MDSFTSTNGCTTVVTIFLSMEAAQVVGRARSIHIDKAFPDTHINCIYIGFLAFWADVCKMI